MMLFLNDPEVAGDPFFGNYADEWNPNVGVGIYATFEQMVFRFICTKNIKYGL